MNEILKQQQLLNIWNNLDSDWKTNFENFNEFVESETTDEYVLMDDNIYYHIKDDSKVMTCDCCKETFFEQEVHYNKYTGEWLCEECEDNQ